jgi:glycerophosphoryl diester phosphodiesterase
MPEAARKNRPLLLGHRGARAVKAIPENTVASFDQALADGCDGFEFDVRLSADGIAVVCHDPKTEGVEIQHARADQLPHLFRLEDVLSRYQENAVLDIELKVSGLEAIASDLLHKYPPRCEFVVSSFLPEVLQTIQARDSRIPVGLICETGEELSAWTQISVEYVMPHYRLIDRGLVCELKDAGKRILVWTVNSPADMKRFAELGVDGIISDETSILCSTLKN